MSHGAPWLSARKGSRLGVLLALGLGVAALVSTGALLGTGALLLGLAAASLAGAIGFFWSSLLGVRSDRALSVEEALALVVPTSEEERKQAVLRTLKDLEYERIVGKISDQDYTALVAHHRAEAKRLLYLIDQQDAERLTDAERLWRNRLASEGLLPPRISAAPAPTEPTTPTPKKSDEQGQPA
jgi:hypothetical protein